MSMTTVYFYEFVHINMSAMSAQRHFLVPFLVVPGHNSMLVCGMGPTIDGSFCRPKGQMAVGKLREPV